MEGATKKRLGQYFSGNRVAELLVRLCRLSGNETVIDPMAGRGDMLKAAARAGIPTANLYGIEIDREAALACEKEFGGGRVLGGDAFSQAPYRRMGATSWDVVITNPPYVRYQSMSNPAGEINVQNAAEIRGSLSRIIDSLDHLTREEKACFQRITKSYSGLSDLAVPSWILCAALVRRGGVLAMVLPESWMNRDYALSIKYLLLMLFDMEVVVEDWNAVWFSDALIKTNLIVARRSALRDNPAAESGKHYPHLRLGTGVMGKLSLVEGLQFEGRKGQAALEALVRHPGDVSGDGFELRWAGVDDFLSGMAATQGFGKLLGKPDACVAIQGTSLPKELREVVGMGDVPPATADLAAWGFQVGQGLRTGANKFFYTKLAESGETVDFLDVDRALGGQTLGVASRYSIPALRYQADAKDKYRVTKEMLSHRLLYIDEQFFDGDGALRDGADGPLADYIRRAGELLIESGGKKTRFPELSAVRPNTRQTTVDGKTVQRHWFMLPTLAKRHLPQLCVSRVNYKYTRCLAVRQGIVVDANFSTLWANEEDDRRMYAMLALMNSSWVRAYLECIGSVMGGGALKVEATHLRRLKLPVPSDDLTLSLARLGRLLAESDAKSDGGLIGDIDSAILSSMPGTPGVEAQGDGLRQMIQSKQDARNR